MAKLSFESEMQFTQCALKENGVPKTIRNQVKEYYQHAFLRLVSQFLIQ